jgi:predicted alpha/beta superfamily hydrolase
MGKCYPDFLQREVMPLIEERYSISKGPENTGLGGSSLGGLIALYTQLATPGIFGRLLIESPSLFVANRKILKESTRFTSWPERTYLGMGTQETGDSEKNARIVADARELEAIFREAGLDEQRLKVRIEEGATHSEAAWAARFPEALEFLYSS